MRDEFYVEVKMICKLKLQVFWFSQSNFAFPGVFQLMLHCFRGETFIIKPKSFWISITFNKKSSFILYGVNVDPSRTTSQKESIWQRWRPTVSDFCYTLKILHHRLFRLDFTQITILFQGKSSKFRWKSNMKA